MTDEFEDRLRSALRTRADSVTVGEDRLDDLAERERRQRRSRRTATAVAIAFAVIALPAAGFAFGRVTAPSRSSTQASARSSSPTTGPGGGANASVPAGPNGPELTPLQMPKGSALDHLFTRTTATGVTARVFLSRGIAVSCGQRNAVCPAGPPAALYPASCATSMVVAELSTQEAVTIGSSTVARGSGAGQQTRIAGAGTFGVGEGAPASWVIVEAGGVARVRARFSAGSTDEMAPIGGIAVLASRVSNGGGSVSVDTIDSRGNVTSGPSVPAGSVIGSQPSLQYACPMMPAPPPTLPPPGVQPPNPAAARAAIEHAYALVYDGASADPSKAAALEDSGVILPLLQAAANGPQGATVKAASARVLGVVFTSPTSAAVHYQVLMNGALDLDLVGSAVYVDGSWRVARGTICGDLGLVGQSCPAR